MRAPSGSLPTARIGAGPSPRSLGGRVRTLLLGITPDAATFAARGFRGEGDATQRRLERIGGVFLEGYHAALADPAPAPLAAALDAAELELRGFAFEGASMALALLDAVLPFGASRLRAFIDGPAQRHVYMAHVGAGWAWARLRLRVASRPEALHPLLGWLAVDGYGFHQGYFAPRRFVDEARPPRLHGYAARAFDQGLGRSLWFVEGAHPERLASRVARFPPGRRPDLWSGIGLACAYAGGSDARGVERLRDATGEHWPHFAQGMTFAAEARARAGLEAEHTDLACRVGVGRTAAWAAALAIDALAEVRPAPPGEPGYERWRRRIRERLSEVRA